MRSTTERKWWIDPLDPRGVFCFLLLALLWVAVWGFLPRVDWAAVHIIARLAGYGEFAAMLVPFVHIIRRSFPARLGRLRMSFWLRMHIGCAYVAFALVLVHSQAHAGSWLTLALYGLTWVVMASGVVGFYGQKLLYALLPQMKNVPQEFGFERLEPEREKLLADARAQQKKAEAAKAPQAVQEFIQMAIDSHLARRFRLLPRRRRRTAKPGEVLKPGENEAELEENGYSRALLMAADEHGVIVKEVWQLVQARRRLDYEYRLHQLGRLWLLIHGPASWALLVLLIEHVWVSVANGGW